ncbi:hypothetical protein KWI08_02650 [Morganella morganii]|uniref:hypothetical protein n=1 Tax=Morganella morganii TaxID=582 RepID=UPI0021CEC4BD|nr:hypothetical protein [Morganella morganii]MCU6272815.1 hypothetical protein [Morganella morganii]
MILGVSKTDITPSLPVRLGGFAFRHQPCTQIGMPLYARCFIWDRQYAVVSLELLFAGDNLDRQIRIALADIPELAGLDHFCLCAISERIFAASANISGNRLVKSHCISYG